MQLYIFVFLFIYLSIAFVYTQFLVDKLSTCMVTVCGATSLCFACCCWWFRTEVVYSFGFTSFCICSRRLSFCLWFGCCLLFRFICFIDLIGYC